jgi:hypothetical protein
LNPTPPLTTWRGIFRRLCEHGERAARMGFQHSGLPAAECRNHAKGALRATRDCLLLASERAAAASECASARVSTILLQAVLHLAFDRCRRVR